MYVSTVMHPATFSLVKVICITEMVIHTLQIERDH